MQNDLHHVAIIADGNGRWADRRGLKRKDGHKEGLEKIEEIGHWTRDLGIQYLSVYCFSLENWNRPKEEVDELFNMANCYFDRYPEFVEDNVKIIISGCNDRLSDVTLEKMERIQEATKNCTSLTINLCCNYSGQREIEDAIKKGARTIAEINKALYQDIPFPDLIIRTGGYRRLSNFLLWQSAYSELYFTPTLFPNFSRNEYEQIISWFDHQTRKFGTVGDDK